MKTGRACAECGRELPPGAPDGLCPTCLLGVGAAELGISLEMQKAECRRQNETGKVGEQRSEVGGQRSEVRGRKAEVRGQKSEASDSVEESQAAQDEEQKAGVSGQWSVVSGPSSVVRGQKFGNYELLERIAQGGMGVVYKARQLNLDRIVAVKLLPFGPFSRPEEVGRFRAEASAAASLQHPNIVAIHEVGEHEGQPYYSMDYVEGRTLADLARDQPSAPKQAATYLKTIAEAVHYAHQHGILHRDLKPANVMIDGKNQPRITDFGLAKRLSQTTDHGPRITDLTLTGQVLGSPNFMSPEQAEGRHKEVGPASDVYALGGLLYHLLTRQPPFQADTVATLLKQVIESEPISPRLVNASVPRDLETICLKCLEKDKTRRYPTAQALAEELGRFLEDKPISARPVSTVAKSWKWCRRRPVLAGLGAVLLASLLAGATGVLWQLHMTRLAKLMAERREYVGNVALVQGLINGKQFDRATDILNLRTPEQYRGWEWGWLQRQCHQDLMTLAGAGSIFVAFSPDSRLLATGGFRVSNNGPCKIALWDSKTGELVRTSSEGMKDLGQVAFSPDGRQLASAGWDECTVRTWEVATGRLLHSLTNADGTYFLSYSPDGKKLAGSCWDGKVRIWDTDTWRMVAESPPYGDELYCAEFSPDGRFVAYGGGYYRFAQSRDTSVRVWDPASGEVKRMDGHTELVMRTVWHPKTNLLASVGGDGTVKLWDPQVAREIATLKSSAGPGYLLNAAFSPDGRRLVVAGGDTPSGTARLEVFDVQTRQLLYSLDGHANVVCGVAFSPDGRLIASAAFDNTVKVWAAERPPSCLTFEGHNQTVWTVAFSPDGKYLATGSLDLTAKIWDTTTGALVQSLPVNYPVFALAFNPEGNRLLTVGPEHMVCVWKVGRQLPENPQPRLLSGHREHVLAVAWSPDNLWTASGGRDDQIILREASNGHERRRLLGHTNAILALAFCPSTRLLASGSEDATVRLWDPESGRCVQILTNHQRPVISLAFSPDGRLLASGGEDGMARLWDTRNWRELQALRVSAGGPSGMAFSPDGRRLATAGGGRDLSATVGRESRIRLWDVALGQQLLAFFPHTNAVYGVAFSPDGHHLATASGDNTARLWTAFPWKSADYPGEAHEPLASRIEAYKRHDWPPTPQPPSDPARHLGFQVFGYFNLPVPGSKNQPAFPTPPRGARATAEQLDLTICYNVALKETWQPLDWVHDTSRCLESIEAGLQTLAGVRFDVRGMVQLRRASPDCEPFPLEAWIPTGRTFRHLHALHGARWPVREGLPIAAFVLHYADGTQAELPVLYGVHLRHESIGSEGKTDCSAATLAWVGPPQIYKATFLNPHPEREVQQIEYVSRMTQSAPFLVALTVD